MKFIELFFEQDIGKILVYSKLLGGIHNSQI